MGMFDTLVSFHAMERDNPSETPSQEFLDRLFRPRPRPTRAPHLSNETAKIFHRFFGSLGGIAGLAEDFSIDMTYEDDRDGYRAPDGGSRFLTDELEAEGHDGFHEAFLAYWDKPKMYPPAVQKALKDMMRQLKTRTPEMFINTLNDFSSVIYVNGRRGPDHTVYNQDVFGELNRLEDMTPKQAYYIGYFLALYRCGRFLQAMTKLLNVPGTPPDKGKIEEKTLLTTAPEVVGFIQFIVQHYPYKNTSETLLSLPKSHKGVFWVADHVKNQAEPAEFTLKIGSRLVTSFADVKALRTDGYKKIV